MARRGAGHGMGGFARFLSLAVFALAAFDSAAAQLLCIRSCLDQGNYVRARVVNGSPQCLGNATDCSWYTDAGCTDLTSDSLPPLAGQGLSCASIRANWCTAASFSLVDGNPVTVTCAAIGDWTCVKSCKDKGNYVRVRNRGIVYNGGTVQCVGPDNGKCSWVGWVDGENEDWTEPARSRTRRGFVLRGKRVIFCFALARYHAGPRERWILLAHGVTPPPDYPFHSSTLTDSFICLLFILFG